RRAPSSSSRLLRRSRVVYGKIAFYHLAIPFLVFMPANDSATPPDSLSAVNALSPLDGRYAAKLEAVRRVFSEAGLMRERVRVECAWLLALAAGPAAATLGALPHAARAWAAGLAADPAATDVPAIKAI